MMRDIGFIGVGAMGAPMALRLIDAGYRLTIFDPNPSARECFSGKAKIAAAASECGSASMIIAMVQSDSQLHAAILGADGLLSGITRGGTSLIAVMSTVLPETIAQIAEAVAPKSVRVIDAPVSGGSSGAEAGTLSIMAGGAVSDLEEARPVFETLGRTIYHCGELGSGELTKIVNNLLGVTTTFLLGEALTIGKRYGLDLPRLASIMEASSGRCFGTRDWAVQEKVFAHFAHNPAAVQSVTAVSRKDVKHAVALAKAAGLQTPLADRILEAMESVTHADIYRQWSDLSKDPVNPADA